jgi:hypothetical protein
MRCKEFIKAIGSFDNQEEALFRAFYTLDNFAGWL